MPAKKEGIQEAEQVSSAIQVLKIFPTQQLVVFSWARNHKQATVPCVADCRPHASLLIGTRPQQ
jgi:hypothetical protein